MFLNRAEITFLKDIITTRFPTTAVIRTELQWFWTVIMMSYRTRLSISVLTQLFLKDVTWLHNHNQISNPGSYAYRTLMILNSLLIMISYRTSTRLSRLRIRMFWLISCLCLGGLVIGVAISPLRMTWGGRLALRKSLLQVENSLRFL